VARGIGAELDVTLARKLRAPNQPEFALGALSEDGAVYWNPNGPAADEIPTGYIEAERSYQLAEIDRRKRLFRGIRPAARVEGRSVIVTDDGIATGSTVIAALRAIRGQEPLDLIVAVPVAPADCIARVRRWCDEMVCLVAAIDFNAVGDFYEDFATIEDEDVVRILQQFAITPHSMSGLN
jgi:predicted phosphoribosyltransferase